MNHSQRVTNVRKHPNKRDGGHVHLNKGTEHHNHPLIEITCGHSKQKCGPVTGTAQNIEFYDAFISFSGLKSTFPN